MGNINPIFNDRVRYTLRSKDFESLIITEPIGWQTDDKEFARHEKYHAIITKFSNSLKFIGSGAEYIQLILDLNGINAEVQLTRDEKHPQTDAWTLTYSGFLDLSTWIIEKNQLSVKFDSGGLEQLLRTRESEKVEIDRETTIDKKPIPPLQTIDVELEGRRIFLKTSFEQYNDQVVELYNLTKYTGAERGCLASSPFKLKNKSHEEAQSPSLGTIYGDNSTLRTGDGSTGLMFFANSQVDRVLKIRFRGTFKAKNYVYQNLKKEAFYMMLKQYQNGSLYNHKINVGLVEHYNVSTINNQTFGFEYDGLITLLQGESLALSYEQHFEGETAYESALGMRLSDTKFDYFTIEEDSYQAPTNTKSIFAYEAGERLVAIATNKTNAFYSEFLARTDVKNLLGKPMNYKLDGIAGFTAITHGFWVRNFDKLPIGTELEPNMFKPLTTSFKDYVSSLSAVWNIGIGIEKFGLSERVRIEELGYFFNRNVTIKLPNQIQNVKRSIAVDKFYSSLEFGYAEGGDYEEACGLDEYNAKSNFTTVINRVKNIYSMISDYRADSYGMEFARRKQKSLNDTEDTRYDSSIWINDLIYRGKQTAVNGNLKKLYSQRKWQDDFFTQPTGVFSPETATNLRFSPFNCLLRHSWWFSNGLQKYLSDYVRYGSSTANSQLKTNQYSENGDIVNAELQKPRFLPEEIEFEHICDFDIMQQVNGVSTILGKEIPNFYGLVEFTNEKNETEKGFLMNLKPNGNGKWKILKSNR